MVWFLFAGLSAGAHAGYNLFSKRLVANVDRYVVAAAVAGVAAFFAWSGVLLFGVPALGPGFWPAFAVEIVMEALALGLYLKSLEKSEVSLAVPLLALTPTFLLITTPLITGETISSQGVLGVGLAVIGTYVLAFEGNAKKQDLLSPFRQLASNEGLRLMLLTAAAYSITANYYAIVARNSSPLFTSAAIDTSSFIIFAGLVAWKAKPLRQAQRMKTTLVASGFFAFLGGVALSTALQTGLTPLVISIRRLSIPLTVLLGHGILKEGQFKQRILASLILLAGAVLILTA